MARPFASTPVGSKPPWNQPQVMFFAFNKSPTFFPAIVTIVVVCNRGLVSTQSSFAGRGSPIIAPVVEPLAILPEALAVELRRIQGCCSGGWLDHRSDYVRGWFGYILFLNSSSSFRHRLGSLENSVPVSEVFRKSLWPGVDLTWGPPDPRNPSTNPETADFQFCCAMITSTPGCRGSRSITEVKDEPASFS